MDQQRGQNDTWTHVGRGKGRSRTKGSDLTRSQPHSSTWPPLDSSTTAAKITAEFEARSRIWKSSACRKQLRQILDRQRPDEGWKIRRAVCLGSGSFSRENLANRRRSGFQFAAFMDVVGYLKEEEGMEEMTVVAQEPMYTDMDMEFLAGLGVDVVPVQSPTDERKPRQSASDLWTVLGEPAERTGTFVCELFLERDVDFLQRLLDVQIGVALSSIMSAHGWMMKHARSGDKNDSNLTLDQVVSRDYQRYLFPHFIEDPNIFEGLSVFSRVPDDDDDQGG